METLVRAEDATVREQGRLRPWSLQWTPVIAGALAASALSLILISFAAALGLGVASAAPTWRDASFALWLLSGVFLIFQALISFGCGGYFAGRIRAPYSSVNEDVATRDGMHGVASWALAVVIGAVLTALVAGAASKPSSSMMQAPSSSEPSVLSYEVDRLFRAPRRPPNVDLSAERAEAARILMTSSSHNGVATDDRAYLVQQVTALTGLTGPDSEKRVDATIVNAKQAISRARAASIILAFSAAAALLFGAVAAWAGAAAGGRHRDGAPLSTWMTHSNRWSSRPAETPQSMP
ncbi:MULTISPECIES: hypothetical protein [Bradyrhizobium]|uniref:hypothetical protein n=1 Tax=Bradyrhizobium TaxID=374 RepID=UPI001BA98A98|nr:MULTISPECIES: hypothetical protein [Bradyrhizobium]MBR0706410.1 hypothetical protein [Bradyrhizobium liaoningense]MDA9404393.1 hypothetical protein [Bradyrhizobium sp. CCBAU 45389]